MTQKSFLMKQQSYKKLSSKQLVHLYMRSSYVSGSNLQGIRKNLQGKSAISAEKHEYYVGVAKKIEEKEQRREQEVGEAEMDRQERRRVESIVRIQAFFRRHHKRKAYKQLVKQARYRRHILAEIISTEAQYVHDLQLTIDLLLTPLEAVLKPGEVQGLFANVKQIHQLNSQLLGELQQRFSKYHPNCTVADVMVKHAPSFAIYFEYYNNFKTQEQLQHTLKASNPKYPPPLPILGSSTSSTKSRSPRNSASSPSTTSSSSPSKDSPSTSSSSRISSSTPGRTTLTIPTSTKPSTSSLKSTTTTTTNSTKSPPTRCSPNSRTSSAPKSTSSIPTEGT